MGKIKHELYAYGTGPHSPCAMKNKLYETPSKEFRDIPTKVIMAKQERIRKRNEAIAAKKKAIAAAKAAAYAKKIAIALAKKRAKENKMKAILNKAKRAAQAPGKHHLKGKGKALQAAAKRAVAKSAKAVFVKKFKKLVK